MFAWNNKGHLLVMDSVERAASIFHITDKPELEYTDEELRENFGLLRIIDNKVVMGLTEEEKQDKKLVATYEIALLKEKLAETDYIVLQIVEDDSKRKSYQEILDDRKKWREEIAEYEKDLEPDPPKEEEKGSGEYWVDENAKDVDGGE